MAHNNLATSISGMGVVTPFGPGVAPLWDAIKNKKSCLENGLGKIAKTSNLKALELALAAISEAMDDAGWDHLTPEDAIIVGTTTGLIDVWETDFMEYLTGQSDLEQMHESFKNEPLGILGDLIAEHLSHNGPQFVISTACSSSMLAIGKAHEMIQAGIVKRCLVGGVETLSELTIQGFTGLKLIDNKVCRPFDKDRSGINLAEGAAFLCLEKIPGPQYIKVLGAAHTLDAHHMTAPHPKASGLLQAMRQTLDQAQMGPEKVSSVHAHGTGSPLNDKAESVAINNLFANEDPYTFSTKSYHGHTLAAAGALETIISAKSIRENRPIETLALEAVGDDIQARCQLNEKDRNITTILNTTLGFGGINAALLLSK